MKHKTFKFSDRAKQKELSRARDEARLRAGEVTPSELQKENAFVKSSGFAKKKIGFSPKCRPANGDRYYTVEQDKPATDTQAKSTETKETE